ncbi:unnamed protein product [Chrysoparadoxa australica]
MLLLCLPLRTLALRMSSSNLPSRKRPRSLTPIPGPQGSLPPKVPLSSEKRKKFSTVVNELLEVEKEEELPGIMAKHVEFILSVDATALMNDMIRDDLIEVEDSTLHNVHDFMVSFAEEFVDNVMQLQSRNAKLLGEIVAVAKSGAADVDQRLEEMKPRIDFEFLRHLDSEIERLKKLEGQEMLNVMTVIRWRVARLLDEGLSEEVALLGRLLAFEDRFLMRAALQTALQKRDSEGIALLKKLVEATHSDASRREEPDFALTTKLRDVLHDIDSFEASE